MQGLDLFSGAGGIAAGFISRGHQMTGVDILPLAGVYPGNFVQGDALEYAYDCAKDFDFIISGPPCQFDSMLTAGTNQHRKHMYPEYTRATMAFLRELGKPYIIENPPGNTPIRRDRMLCGEMFNLRVIRHRWFEVGGGWETKRRLHKPHRGRVQGWRHGEYYDGYYFAVYGDGGGKGSIKEWQDAMGIDWMHERKLLAEAIPPAYGRWFAKYLPA